MTEKQPATNTPARGRSPAYPGIDLERALHLARQLYKQARQHPAASEVVAHHWGLKSKSSAFLTAISALKKFGLVDSLPQRGSHSGHVKLSELGLNIILDERDSSAERDARIREAALKPEIHADLWRKYQGELPSDPDLRFHLVRERKFTEAGAKEFIAEFRRTVAFAGLSSSDVLSDADDDKMADAGSQKMADLMEQMKGFPQQPPPVSLRQASIKEVPIPIQGTAWPALKGAFPMTEEAWNQMIAVLNAMKPGLVQAPNPEDKKED